MQLIARRSGDASAKRASEQGNHQLAGSTRPGSTLLLDQVAERDVDLILLSALFVSETFRAFVLKEVMGWTKTHHLIRTRVSEVGDAGETDVLLVVDLGDGDRLGLMIEDKISAIFQPAQADRYRQRGNQGIHDGQWTRFLTCLCAPESYVLAARPAKEWNAYISLEAIRDWASFSQDRFHQFLSAICEEAIAKREARMKAVSLEATAFWCAYRQLAAELLPNVGISRLPEAVSALSPWPRFGASAIPDEIWLEHKPQQGRVDLTFHKVPLEALKEGLPATLPFDIKPTKAGGSAALRIAVPRIDHLRPFDGQQDEVLSVFAAVERLLAVGRAITTEQIARRLSGVSATPWLGEPTHPTVRKDFEAPQQPEPCRDECCGIHSA